MKRKHPEHEQRRTTQRPYRERSGGWRPQGKVDSASPTESQDGPHLEHLGNEGELEMDREIWQAALRYAQQQIDHDNADSTNLATNAPINVGGDSTHLNTDSLPQQPSMNELNDLDQIVQNATDLERSLLVGTSSLNPAQHLDTQIQQTIPQSAPFDTNMTGFNFNQGLPDSLLFMDSLRLQDDWFPSSLQLTRGRELFFAHVSPFIPFLHQSTFDVTQTAPLLALSMLCLGYQYGDDPECGDQAGSGVGLSTRCFHRARALISFSSDEAPADGLTNNVMIVQSHLLLQICAMMYLCGDDSAYGLKIHSNMISLVRTGGLMAPATNASATTEDLESLWREFIKTESHKRTAFAVHQIDALWYQFLSIPRSISHLEIKHELPSPEDYWTASSSVEWAHRQLVSRHSGPSVQYTDAVRQFLSSDADLTSISRFDPYGAINITQFLLSSAREISGWSAMTGMLSMDRFSALRSSLVALSRFICPEQQPMPSAKATTHTAAVSRAAEATWETAMIELHMWSPSHTGGIVEASIDAVLNQLTTYLGPSCGILESTTAKAIQPHVNWFLRYLDMTLLPDSEAPWIAFYAYKAFLIAWQLMHGRVAGAMQVVGVRDGDVEGALGWARKVFERRRRWQLGRLILACLDELGE
ncbi:uncharacterized protein ASPGLDRAFT_1064363 [Aspergillus glaucus CBS 516.65]|uniref:Xylanolytic transcriptional activator regulatory domain-containing protein n=1 Tax=Aspergillus glaucus CBS 516.65 TaxID=1160497 RepID=A0A1L9V5E8_ASPGL|nr:hypothetical protein ASPGLDRAFT_1064363 [Aspergillus glaucus CBS 516.65]OJJ79150.1 hypothetical protein ASPGLDRAFT_1064363 [Aspergillus glaucus CBS 516.65]